MIRKIVLALLCLPLTCSAQTITGHVKASQFNNWRVAGVANLAVGANPQVSISPCSITGGGLSFNALAASTPIKIYDPGNPSIDEVLTPTSIVVGSTCTATFTTANAHTAPWNIGSGSFGLQEALNAATQSGVMNVVDLDPVWHTFGGGAATIYAAAGGPYMALSDITISPSASYRWDVTTSHFLSNYSIGGITDATIAAGAAAGSSPTVANTGASTSNIITADVTTGTATTTGTLFTETVSAFPAVMNCTVQSVGTNVPPVYTVSTSTTVLTVAVAVAPAVSTAYVFNVTCL